MRAGARRAFFLGGAVFAAVALAGAVARAEPDATTLKADLAAIAARHHGQVGLWATNLATGQTVALAADTPVPTASVIKLTALYAALVEVREGRARLDETLTLTRDNQVEGSGVLGLLDTPHTLTLKDALSLMIAVSDNTATNLVIDRLGLATINAHSRAIGLRDTVFYKKVFKPIEGPVPPEQPRFGLGRTTPREMAAVMTRLALCQLTPTPRAPDAADRTLCAAAMAMLKAQFYRDGIPRYLESLDPTDQDTAIAEKTGAVDAARNDVAAIATRNGMLILSIFTWDNADHGWTADDEGDLTIARLAQAIVKTWAPRGPDASAWPK